MYKFQLITDSVIDKDLSFFKKHDIKCTPLSFVLDDVSYADDLGETIPYKEFYQKLRDGATPQTGQAELAMFYSHFEESAKKGEDVLYIGFSSGLSGTYERGFIAAKEVMEKYKDVKILTLDSKCAAGGQGLLIHLVQKLRSTGASIEECYQYALKTAPKICHWFTVDDLNFLHRGGRVSKTSAVLGSIIGIKPVLRVDDNGKLEAFDKVRGRKTAVDTLIKKLEQDMDTSFERTVFISHSDCLQEAENIKNTILTRKLADNVEISFLGSVIGSHTGADTVALFFVGKKR